MCSSDLGLTHLEAMASGTPVASTADGGQAEFLEHDGNALVFPKGDAAALAAALARLLDDGALRTRLAREARAMVENRFTMRRYVDDLEALLARNKGSLSASAREADLDRKYLRKLVRKHGLAAGPEGRDED